MLPPWEKYPEIPAGSIGWRMGRGEEYYDAFYRWFSALEASEQAQFALKNQEPNGWRDLYKTITEHPWVE